MAKPQKNTNTSKPSTKTAPSTKPTPPVRAVPAPQAPVAPAPETKPAVTPTAAPATPAAPAGAAPSNRRTGGSGKKQAPHRRTSARMQLTKSFLGKQATRLSAWGENGPEMKKILDAAEKGVAQVIDMLDELPDTFQPPRANAGTGGGGAKKNGLAVGAKVTFKAKFASAYAMLTKEGAELTVKEVHGKSYFVVNAKEQGALAPRNHLDLVK